MANEQNLRTPTTEQARERGRKGGQASARARKKKKELRELLEIALSQPNKDGSGDNWTAAAAALVQKALKGDVKAWEVMRDTLGQKPTEKTETTIKGGEITITIEE